MRASRLGAITCVAISSLVGCASDGPGAVGPSQSGLPFAPGVLTNLGDFAEEPSISGDRIVWLQGRQRETVRILDLATRADSLLTTIEPATISLSQPRISGDYVAWFERSAAGSNIRLTNLVTGDTLYFAGGSLAISSRGLTWVDNGLSLRFHDFESGITRVIVDDGHVRAHLDGVGSLVSWTGGGTAGFLDVDSGAEVQLGPVEQSPTAISESYMIFKPREMPATLHTYELATGDRRNLDSKGAFPDVDGETAVWAELCPDPNECRTVVLHDFARNRRYELANQPGLEAWIGISGNRVVWNEFRGSLPVLWLFTYMP